jgi:hypothetical protein
MGEDRYPMLTEIERGQREDVGVQAFGSGEAKELRALRAELEDTQRELNYFKERQFPIMRGGSIPWSIIAPYEKQAINNHDQSLEVLASRGGLDPLEAVAVLTGKRWRDVQHMTLEEGNAKLQEIVHQHPLQQLAAAVGQIEKMRALLNEVVMCLDATDRRSIDLRDRIGALLTSLNTCSTCGGSGVVCIGSPETKSYPDPTHRVLESCYDGKHVPCPVCQPATGIVVIVTTSVAPADTGDGNG